MLISTLPSLHNRELVEEMFSNSFIGGVRYNIGMRSKYSPEDIIHNLSIYAEKYDKVLWIDLKGRQLRITKWADPTYGDIELNREITTNLPSKVYFRGDKNCYILDDYDKNKLFIHPDPIHALGAGQALNIIGDNVNIIGDYLTQIDISYIKTASNAGIHNYMLSFVEKSSDAQEVVSIDPNAKPVLKIESVKGLDFVEKVYDGKYHLITARDDLSVNLENNYDKMTNALLLILNKDKDAIVASNVFASLKLEIPEDGYDIKRLLKTGYKNFMLDDTVSHRYFKDAIKLWQQYVIQS
jgi:pyruvate kinase